MKLSKNTIKKKITALLVAMAMVFSVMPVMADQVMAYTDNQLTVSLDKDEWQISNDNWGNLSDCTAVYTLINKAGNKTESELTGKEISDILEFAINGYSKEAYKDYEISFIAGDFEKTFKIGDLFAERKAYVGDDTTGSLVKPIIVDTEKDGLRLYVGQKDINDQNAGLSVKGITQIKITSPQNNEEPPATVLKGDTSWYDENQQNFNIANEEELIGLASLVNNGSSFKGKTIALSNSIALTKEWTPIGSAQIASDTNDLTNAKPFEGVFNGKGNTIESLTIENAASFNGLFGFNMGTIKNLTVKGSIAGTSECDYIGGVVGFNGGIIENVKSDVSIDVGAAANVGGIAGINTSGLWARGLNKSNKENILGDAIGSIKGCENLNVVTANQKVGGICGYNAGIVETSSNDGKVTANRGRKSCGGGIVGMNGNNNTAYSSGTVKNCYNTANVDAKTGAWVGGVVGFNSGTYGNPGATPSKVENCYFIGEIVEPFKDISPDVIVGESEAPATSVVNNYNKADLDKEVDKGVASLGDTYIVPLHGENAGYPIFAFQEKHIFDKYKTVKKASFGVAGEKIAYCDCGEENHGMIEEIPAVKTPVLSTTNYSFNNKVRNPSVTVKDAAGATIAKGVYGKGGKVVGKYPVKVSLSGDDYTGYKTVYFKINPSASKISSLSKGRKSITVKWAKPSSTYRKQMTGYQIRYSTSSKMTNAKTVTIKSTTAKSKTIKGLKAKKKYYVQIRKYKKTGGTTYYSTWSTYKATTTR